VRRAAWALLSLTGLDLAGREIARQSLLSLVLGHAPSLAVTVAVGVIAAAAAIAVSRGRRIAGLVLAACFTIGLALQIHLGARLQSDGFYYFAYLRSLAFDRDVDLTEVAEARTLSERLHQHAAPENLPEGAGNDHQREGRAARNADAG